MNKANQIKQKMDNKGRGCKINGLAVMFTVVCGLLSFYVLLLCEFKTAAKAERGFDSSACSRVGDDIIYLSSLRVLQECFFFSVR